MKKQYKVVSLNATLIDHAAFAQLILDSKEAVAAFNKANKKEPVYASKLARLEEVLTQYLASLHQSKGSQHAKALEEADKQRDNAFTTLANLIRAFSKVAEPATKEAYDQLSRLLKNYSNLSVLSYERETEGINHLLDALKEESYQTALTRLHLTAHVTSLKQAQKAFEKVYAERLKEQKGKTPSQTRELRLQLQEIYDFLVDFTALYSYAYPELVAFSDLHKQLNVIRSRYKKTRPNRPKAQLEKPENSSQAE